MKLLTILSTLCLLIPVFSLPLSEPIKRDDCASCDGFSHANTVPDGVEYSSDNRDMMVRKESGWNPKVLKRSEEQPKVEEDRDLNVGGKWFRRLVGRALPNDWAANSGDNSGGTRVTGNNADGTRVTRRVPDGVEIRSDDPDSVRITSDDPDNVRITTTLGNEWRKRDLIKKSDEDGVRVDSDESDSVRITGALSTDWTKRDSIQKRNPAANRQSQKKRGGGNIHGPSFPTGLDDGQNWKGQGKRATDKIWSDPAGNKQGQIKRGGGNIHGNSFPEETDDGQNWKEKRGFIAVDGVPDAREGEIQSAEIDWTRVRRRGKWQGSAGAAASSDVDAQSGDGMGFDKVDVQSGPVQENGIGGWPVPSSCITCTRKSKRSDSIDIVARTEDSRGGVWGSGR